MKKAGEKSDDRYERGLQTLAEIDPGAKKRLSQLFPDIAPDLARWIVEFPYAEVYSRPQLDLQMRELVTIASLVTTGNVPQQLKTHIRNALRVGCRQEQVIETILQMAVYAGFPKAINGLAVAADVLKEQKEEAANDSPV